MKKEVLNELEKINEATKMPEEVKKAIMKKIYKNMIIGIFTISYFLLLFLESNIAEKAVRVTGFNVFSMVILLVAIAVFEISYKKDNDTLAIHGIEILAVAIVTLFMPYMYFEATGKSKTLYMLMPIYVGFYYALKATIIAIRENKKYKFSISEIKELVKKEEKKEIDLEEKRKNRKSKKGKDIDESSNKDKVEEDVENITQKTPKPATVEKSTKKVVKEEKKTIEKSKSTKPKETGKNKKPIEKNIKEKSINKTLKPVKSETDEKPKRGRPKKTTKV